MTEAGYYQKFNVSRIDGRDQPGGDREGAVYFTLDLKHDPYARYALMAYVESVQSVNPQLAGDLITLLKTL